MGIIDRGDLTQVDRHAVAHRDDHVADLLQGRELALGAQQNLVATFAHRADRLVEVLITHDAHHVRHVQIQRPQLVELQVHVDLAPQTAADGELRHAGHPLQVRLQALLGEVPQLLGVHVISRHGQEDDRELRDVELEHRRRFHILGQVGAATVQTGAQLIGRLVEVDAVVEADTHVGRAFRAGRSDFLDAGRRGERFLQRSGHERLHLLGTHAGVLGPGADRRIDGLRHQVHGDLDEGDGAEQHGQQASHCHRNGSLDGELRQTHETTSNSAALGTAASPGRPNGGAQGVDAANLPDEARSSVVMTGRKVGGDSFHPSAGDISSSGVAGYRAAPPRSRSWLTPSARLWISGLPPRTEQRRKTSP